jgi:thiamine-phosphate pyrophosphorylase
MARMMTPALETALARAGKYAEGQPMEPVHLIRGLLAEDQGLAARMLAEAGLDLARWRDRFPDDVGVHGDPSEAASMPLSPALQAILEQAESEPARQTDEGSLSTDQVLTSLVAHSATVCGILRADGFDEARFRASHSDSEVIALEEPIDFSAAAGHFDAARLVDAAANRAREGLRVLEDFARFILDDALLTTELKQIRHDLAAALTVVDGDLLLTARDTMHDVGTAVTTALEGERADVEAVVHANAKRLEESLRSLEEYGKVLSPVLGGAIEALRYRVYTLEQTLLLGRDARQRLANARLYVLVTGSLCRASLEDTVREAVLGGADVIQLREKDVPDRALLALARAVRRITRDHAALFIVNDRPDIAFLADADGVHLGQDDVPLHAARKIVGPRAIVGISTHSLGQAQRAVLEGASYLGVGPTFPSRTKEFNELAGLAFVKEATALTSLPAFVLGGVNLDNLESVMQAGGRRVAVSRAICDAEDPRQVAQEFKKKLLAAANDQ